jgi:hypothetical protein
MFKVILVTLVFMIQVLIGIMSITVPGHFITDIKPILEKILVHDMTIANK